MMHDRLEMRLCRKLESETVELADLLKGALPIGEEQRAEAAAWLTFWGAALKHLEFLEITEQVHRDWRSIIQRCIEVSCPESLKWPRKRMRNAISSIVVFMDGLSVKALTRPSMYIAKHQIELLDSHLRSVLGKTNGARTS